MHILEINSQYPQETYINIKQASNNYMWKSQMQKII
jgi:hypothetical protein